MEKQHSFFERFMLFLNVFTILALIASYAGGSISPEQFWPLAFFAMAYPAVLAAMAFFILYWLLKRRWFLFLNIALLLIKWDYVSSTIQFPNSAENEVSDSDIKVMTFNVRLFDKYNWTENAETPKRIIEFVKEQEADILCFQEFYRNKGQDLNLLGRNQPKGFHLKNYFPQRDNENDFGIVILSKFPMVNKGTIILENSRDALTIFSDLVIGADTIRVYNVHLQSLNLGIKGYQLLDEMVDSQELQEMGESKFLLSRLKRGFIKRAKQADKVADHIAKCPYPVIVCGDFNDVPTSYSRQRISSGLQDSFAEAGSGTGATYVKVPFFRIDNILAYEKFKIRSHKVHDHKVVSDHYPVTASISLRD